MSVHLHFHCSRTVKNSTIHSEKQNESTCFFQWTLLILTLLIFVSQGMIPSQVSQCASKICCLKKLVFYSTLELSTHRLAQDAIVRPRLDLKMLLMLFRKLQVHTLKYWKDLHANGPIVILMSFCIFYWPDYTKKGGTGTFKKPSEELR